jgi:hypothetical protein
MLGRRLTRCQGLRALVYFAWAALLAARGGLSPATPAVQPILSLSFFFPILGDRSHVVCDGLPYLSNQPTVLMTEYDCP